MKRLLLVLAMLMFTTAAWAASSITATLDDNYTPQVDTLTYTWTAHTDGSVTSEASSVGVRGWVFRIETDPGATAPTDNYDITITDAAGIDIANGLLANRDTTTTEAVTTCYYVNGTPTLNISNNSVNGATGTVKLFLWTEEGPPVACMTDGGNAFSIDDGGNTITTDTTGTQLTEICNAVSGDEKDLLVPSSGKALRVYQIHVSLDSTAQEDEQVDFEWCTAADCDGSYDDILFSQDEPAVYGTYGFNLIPFYIQGAANANIAADMPVTDGAGIYCIYYTEVTP